jgi:uncharacterized protein YkwD
MLALVMAVASEALAADVRGSAMELQMFELVNRDRAAHGAPALRWDPQLAAVARGHSQDMVQTGFFSHTSPNTGECEARLARGGVAWRAYAENISYHNSVANSERSLMNSPAHRTNLLNPSYDTIGIGIVSNGRQIFVTQNFVKSGQRRTASRKQTRVWRLPIDE